MRNEVNYFPNAKWAMLNGAFTADDLEEIIERIKNPSLQSEPINSEARSEAAIQKTMAEAQEREEARQKHDKE